jgi:hypothetical protein
MALAPRAALSLILPLFLLSLAPACRSASTQGDPDATAAASKDDDDEKDDDEDDADADALSLLKKQREVEYARIELRIAELSAEEEGRDAAYEVADAEDDLLEARKAYDNFVGVEKPMALERSDFGLERGHWSRTQNEQELKELQAMYEAEEFAQLTKELVLMRGEKNLEFAQKDLALDVREAAQLKEFELPKKERELERAKAKAERALSNAKAKKSKIDVERELKLLRAKNALDEAEREIVKLEKDIAKKKEKREKKKKNEKEAAAKTESKT